MLPKFFDRGHGHDFFLIADTGGKPADTDITFFKNIDTDTDMIIFEMADTDINF